MSEKRHARLDQPGGGSWGARIVTVHDYPRKRMTRRATLTRGGPWVRDRSDTNGADAPRRAIVVDELALVRLGVAAVLEPLGIEVVAETHSGRELVSLAAV